MLKLFEFQTVLSLQALQRDQQAGRSMHAVAHRCQASKTFGFRACVSWVVYFGSFEHQMFQADALCVVAQVRNMYRGIPVALVLIEPLHHHRKHMARDSSRFVVHAYFHGWSAIFDRFDSSSRLLARMRTHLSFAVCEGEIMICISRREVVCEQLLANTQWCWCRHICCCLGEKEKKRRRRRREGRTDWSNTQANKSNS